MLYPLQGRAPDGRNLLARALVAAEQIAHLQLNHVEYFFFSSRRRHTRLQGDWSSDVCSSDLRGLRQVAHGIDESEGGAAVARVELARYHRSRPPAHPRENRDVLFAVRTAVRDRQIGRASCRERV